jgi:hypothetical protein
MEHTEYFLAQAISTWLTNDRKHLLSDHYKPIISWRLCNRCQESFGDRNDFDLHMQQCRASPGPPIMASIPDPEDGFDDDIKTLLVSRKDGKKVEKWNALYSLLFPGSIVPNSSTSGIQRQYYDETDINIRLQPRARGSRCPSGTGCLQSYTLE